ncbi:MAG TPA: single-stranded DNA-binding protein [Lysobacter sp.]
MSNFKELVRIGKDAEVRHTQAGKAVTGFSAAFDNGWGEKKQTVWLDCSWWGDRGTKVAEYITKGSQIVVEGNIGTREHDGKTYITLDVSEVKLVSNKSEGGNARPARREPPTSDDRRQAVAGSDFADDDIPF